jgi:hypothetical protein
MGGAADPHERIENQNIGLDADGVGVELDDPPNHFQLQRANVFFFRRFFGVAGAVEDVELVDVGPHTTGPLHPLI